MYHFEQISILDSSSFKNGELEWTYAAKNVTSSSSFCWTKGIAGSGPRAAEFFRSFENLEIKVMSLACVCVCAPDPASLTHQFWNPLAFQVLECCYSLLILLDLNGFDYETQLKMLSIYAFNLSFLVISLHQLILLFMHLVKNRL